MKLREYAREQIKQRRDTNDGFARGERLAFSALLFAMNASERKHGKDLRSVSIDVIFYLRWRVHTFEGEGLLTPEQRGELFTYRDILYKIRPLDKEKDYEGV